MRAQRTLAALVALSLVLEISGCSSGGGGGGGGGKKAVEEDPAAAQGFDAVTFTYSDAPALGEEVVIGWMSPEQARNADWRLLATPRGSRAELVPAADGQSAAFEPDAPGEYELLLELEVNGDPAEAVTTFTVREELPYAADKVQRDDPEAPLDTIIGAVVNQAFVFSTTRNEAQLRSILADYPELTIVGFDSVQGLLVEFDETSDEAEFALDDLSTEPGVDSVAARVHEGDNVPRDELLPDDGSSFVDGGDNWHLESIGAEFAWDETTGSRDFLVGVADSGFHLSHEDLLGRFAAIQLATTPKRAEHGMGVSGAIGARTDNTKGISGLNWTSKIVAYRYDPFRVLDATKGGRKVRLVNNSWTMVGYIPKTFNPSSRAQTTARMKKAIINSRKYRNAAHGKYKDRLFIFSGGNGIGNGNSQSDSNGDGTPDNFGVLSRYNNGVIHLRNDGELSKLDNVLVVAAMTSNERLPFYSQYGPTIDIAAPSGYKSTSKVAAGVSGYYTAAGSYGTNTGGGFRGTSAAAPVVTGAASLVWAANKDLEAKEVKQILVESATRNVTRRYKTPFNNIVPNTEALAHSIPILDLEAAVEAAADPEVEIEVSPTTIVEGERVVITSTVEHGLPPFTYEWTLGDGSTSALPDDSHIYDDGGVYTVRLVVTDALDREASAELQITVTDTTNDVSPSGGGDGDWVVWSTGNVACWGAPLLYVTHRVGFDREELRSSFPGGGIDRETLVEKRELMGGFSSREDANDWICSRIDGFYAHYWCNRHYVVDGQSYRIGNLSCDLSGLREVDPPQ